MPEARPSFRTTARGLTAYQQLQFVLVVFVKLYNDDVDNINNEK